MKIKYLGTGASEGFPGLFCKCDVCERARKAGGKNLRTRAQALVDNKLLLDFGPDTNMHAVTGGFDAHNINTCLITHGHSDHLYLEEMHIRKKGFAYADADKNAPATLHMYASPKTSDIIRGYDEYESHEECGALKLHEIKAYEKFEAEGFEITPLEANHSVVLDPLIYIIKGEKCLLYAHDTDYFTDATWEYLEKNKPYFDFVSLDCTGMLIDYPGSHMGLKGNEEVKERLIKIGCADENTIFVINHFSHNGKLIHDELVPVAQEKGFIVAYDGLEIEF